MDDRIKPLSPIDYKILFASTNNLYLILNANLEIVEANDAFAHVTGLKREDFIAKSIFDIYKTIFLNSNQTIKNLKNSLDKAFKIKQPNTMLIEKVYLRNSHKEKAAIGYWRSINTPILNEDNSIKYIVHCMVDLADTINTISGDADSISVKDHLDMKEKLDDAREQHTVDVKKLVKSKAKEEKGEANLIRSEDKLQKVTKMFEMMAKNNKNLAIYMIDIHGSIIFWNEAAELMTGYSEEEVLGKSFYMFFTRESIEDELPEAQLYFARLNGFHEQGEFIVKKSGKAWVNSIVNALYDEDNNLIGYGILIKDLAAEQRIQKMQDEFIAIVSHELRTPLTSLRGAVDIMMQYAKDLPPKFQNLLQIANNNSNRLAKSVNDIVDIETIELNSTHIRYQNLDAAQVISKAMLDNLVHAKKIGVKLHFKQPDTKIVVHGDSTLLSEIIYNLVNNAIKFSPKGGDVVIECESQGDFAKISIIDEGPGVPDSFKDKIFEKFTQADSSSFRKYGGLGLSLNISKKIIEKFGGKLTYENLPEKGAIFSFTIPLAPNVYNEMALESTFLICEEDIKVAELLKNTLIKHGMKDVLIATNIKQVEKILATHKSVSILMDLACNECSKFCNLIKNLKSARNIPIFAIPAAAENKLMYLCLVLDLHQKTIIPDHLIIAINELVLHEYTNLPRILHVEDDLDIIVVIKNLLENRALLIGVNSVDAAKLELQLNHYDLVLLDIVLPNGSGLDLIKDISAMKIPIIVFTSYDLPTEYLKDVSSVLIKGMHSTQDIIDVINSVIKKTPRLVKENAEVEDRVE